MSRQKSYHVVLTPEQRCQLERQIHCGKGAARLLDHMRVLLKADEGPAGPAWADEAICAAVEVSQSTVSRIRRAFHERGLEAALHRRVPSRTRSRRLDGTGEAHLVALACSAPPEGEVRWTLRALAGRMLELEFAEALSHETVRQVLKKTSSSPGR
jgi:transposase